MSQEDKKSPQEVAVKWWDELTDEKMGQSRAYRAQLRRASTVNEALMHPFTHVLHQRIVEETRVDLRHRPEVLGALAMILAHVKESSKSTPTLARLMGQGSDTPKVSGLRFQRIIRAKSVVDLAPMLRRVLPLVDHLCNVYALSGDLIYWSERTRQDWCFHYYNAIPLNEQNYIEEAEDA